MILDGKKVAGIICDNLKRQVQDKMAKPGLAVILANDNPASRIYISSKEKKALDLGFKSVYKFGAKVAQDEIIKLIQELNKDDKTHAILVQLPVYNHLNVNEIIEAIDPKKDVDGFHPINIGRLDGGYKPHAVCCTPLGIIKLFEFYNIKLEGKKAVVIGRSNIVGKPMAKLLLQKNATVTIAHSKTEDLKSITKQADIIISATGTPNLLKADMVKKDAVVVDVGIIRDFHGKIRGEVEFEKLKDIVSYITPVPGGVGPMTIAMLMQNTYNLFLEAQNAKL